MTQLYGYVASAEEAKEKDKNQWDTLRT